ncbi:MAG: cyclase family protein [Gemmatimonadaceae bacterium]
MRRHVVCLMTAWLLASASTSSDAQERRAPRRPEREGGARAEGATVAGIANPRLVDLTHDLSSATTAWPGSKQGFRLDTITAGRNAEGRYAALFALSLPEHFGTHLDAPHHFDEHGATPAQIPLWRLIGPAVVIDISDSAAANRDYTLSVSDVERFEAEHGRIPENTIVLVRTGYAAYWSNRAKYFGWDSTRTPIQLHFPSLGEAAVRVLVQDRRIAAVGVDVASTDAGSATTFPVHRVLGEAGVPGFESLADLTELPPTGAYVVALAPRIVGGSGGPLRAVALMPRRDRGNRPNRR